METLKMDYFSHIRSHNSFGVFLYGTTSDKTLHNIIFYKKDYYVQTTTAGLRKTTIYCPV